MPGYFGISKGKGRKFDDALDQGGCDPVMVDTLLEHPDLVKGMFSWVRQQLAPPAACGRVFDGSNLTGWYGEPEEQLGNLRRWNDERWQEFTEADLPALPSHWVPTHKFEALVLVAYLGDKEEDGMMVPGYVRTLNTYLDIMVSEQPKAYLRVEDWRRPNADNLKLQPCAGGRHRPGVRWVVVHVDASSGKTVSPASVLSEHSAHAEVAAMCAQMPAYLHAHVEKLGDTLRLWMPGYQTTIHSGVSTDSGWNNVPYLQYRPSGDMMPGIDFWADNGQRGSSPYNGLCPEVRKL